MSSYDCCEMISNPAPHNLF